MRLKTLNGAPECTRLDFSEASLLNTEDCTAFLVPPPENTLVLLSWRAVAPKGVRLRTGWTQPQPATSESIPTPQREQFPTFARNDATQLDTTLNLDESMTDDFLQHSIIFHDNLQSSQVVQDADQTVSSSSFMTTSFGSTPSEFSFPSESRGQTLLLRVPEKVTVTTIGALPNAQTLRSIYPQTPTPNLICVLTARLERREVLVRKTGQKMTLCELLVADDTRSGFKVTFWLRPARTSNNEQTNRQNMLDQTLKNIEIGDILLLRNIALTSFRDIVYGQSINPGIARARTSIDILTKSSGAIAQPPIGLPSDLIDAYMRVRKWARAYVAGGTGSRKRKGFANDENAPDKRTLACPSMDDSLPPDTMEAI